MLLLYKLRRLKYDIVLILMISTAHLISVQSHVCFFVKMPDPSRGGIFRWSLPKGEICRCQRVLTADIRPACPGRNEYKAGNLWFVDDPRPLISRSNWRQDKLDKLLQRNKVCDELAPSFETCPADFEIQTDMGKPSDMVLYNTPSASDNSGYVSVMCEPPSGSDIHIGQNRITCEALDSSGSSASCVFLVDVRDEEDPLVSACPADLEMQTDPGSHTAVVTYQTPTATDNSGDVIVMCAPPSESEFAIGITGVTCTAQDGSGNSASCGFVLHVKDEEDPLFSACPTDQEMQTDPGSPTAVVTYQINATDNSGEVPLVTCAPPSESQFAIGPNSVVCTAKDVSENSVTCEFTVDIKDKEDPLISACPADLEVQLDPGIHTAVITYQTPTATDNSGDVIVTCAPPSESEFAIGQTNVTCTAQDNSGNTATCRFVAGVKGMCKAGWPVVDRTDVDGVGLTEVSPGNQLCNGQVTKWTYQGKHSRPFQAIVFRPVSGSGTQFQIVGINDIPAGAVDVPVTYNVSEAERITSAEGDVIGWSFENPVIATNTGGSAELLWFAHSSLESDDILDFSSGHRGNHEYSIEATVQSK